MSSEARQELSSQGYTVLRGIFATDFVEGLREAIAETMNRIAAALRAPYETSRPDAPIEDRLNAAAAQDQAYALALFRAVMADTHRDQRIQSVSTHPGLSTAIKDVLAPLERSGDVIRTRAVVPAFSKERSGWHQDVVRPSGTATGCGAVKVACWAPLADTDESSGALEVLPGQWTGPFPHEEGQNGHFHIPDERLPDVASKIVTLRRGDVLLLDRYIPHRPLAIQGHKARWTIAMWVKTGAAARDRY